MTNATDEPWSKFYWDDYASDPGLRVCSLAAQGLWMRMLCLMAKASPKGELRIGGEPCSVQDLAISAGASDVMVAGLLNELERRGVYSTTRAGVIYSRRMRKDAEISKKRAKNGKIGANARYGNKTANEICHGKKLAKGLAKSWPQKPEARNQKPDTKQAAQLTNLGTGSANASPGCGAAPDGWNAKENLDKLEAMLREAAGFQRNPAPGLFDLSAILGVLDQGADLHGEILPAIRAKPNQNARSWSYFVKQIQDFRAKRRAAAASPLPEILSKSGPGPPPRRESRYAAAMRNILKKQGMQDDAAHLENFDGTAEASEILELAANQADCAT